MSCVEEFISIRGLAKSLCDIFPAKIRADTALFDPIDFVNIKNHSKVFVPTGSLHKFVKYIQGTTIKFTLFTGAGVLSVPNEVSSRHNMNWKQFMERHVVRWYAQNIDIVHENIHPVPIGIDFHTFQHNPQKLTNPCEQNDILRKVKRAPFSQRMNKVYIPIMARMKRYGNDRARAYGKLSRSNTIFEFQRQRLQRPSLWNVMSKYKFVLSPLGMGMDCHRTWEIFALGGIPIVKNSSLVPTLFRDAPNLIVVTDWREVTRKTLKYWLHKYKHVDMKYNMEFASLKHWADYIKAF